MVVIPRFGADANPDYPKNSPPRPTPVSSATPTATDIIASVTTSTTSSPTSSSTSDAGGFLHIASDGTSGDKILRGFLIGMAIGIILSFVLCCWLPCCRKKRRSRLQRRNDNIRRRLVVLEDEAWVNQNWPPRRPWDVGEDESQSQSQSHVSHD
ncbi:hypothetical protein THARTR1_03439 [Trichoderma harzianum]|uniref:Uncharacterized protein n=1 Tax=Trichoderma harzianum TaxID=5544 RepID=A0A2K0UG28_TRIHA|nr:hypothetical protein THARTR1_03439 [Trichoderma harzianum]